MFRIGLLVNGTSVPGAIEDLVDWIDRQPDIELAALVVHPVAADSRGARLRASIRSQGFYRTLSKVAFAAIAKIERRFLAPDLKDFVAAKEIGERCDQIVRIDPLPSSSGLIHRFADADVEVVKGLGLDLLVRCGAGILRGNILGAARCGVLSMHHGDNRVNRGGPAGFWEVLHRQPATGFIVQQLTEELDGGKVLCRGSFTTRRTYALNEASLLQRSNLYLKRTIRELADGRERREDPLLYAGRLYRAPLLHQTARYVWGLATWIAAGLVRRATRRYLDWQIAFAHGHWRDAVLWRAQVVANPPGHFLADPFPFSLNGGTYILAEDYCYRTGRGHIAALEVQGKAATMVGPAVVEDFHMSFPFVFTHEDETYMVPETSEARQIRLYRCIGGPTDWEFVAPLMEDVAAVDTIIFPKEGRWWLLTTIVEGRSNLNDSELYAFYSDHPLGGWKPHARNPVVADAGSGRNGGILRDGDEVYRVAQTPGFAFYGRGFSIRRIIALTPEDFAEELVQDVGPSFAPGVEGTHHLAMGAGLVTFDFMRRKRISRRD
jgi:hypothetical protein